MEKYKYEEFIGKVFNNSKVLKFSHKIGNKLYLILECLNCEEEFIKRSDRIENCRIKCPHCKWNPIPLSERTTSTPESFYKSYYNNYKKQALNRGLEFEINYELFKVLILEECAYCGKPPTESLYSKSKNKSNLPSIHNGIDREDNNRGYTIDNTLPCCTKCNMMKKTLTFNDFTGHVGKIYERLYLNKN